MRLIDADELIKILEEYANDKGSQAIYGEERLRLILGDCKIEIEKFPTAYDVDKVVERLEVNSMFAQADDEPFVMLDDAVEIVKSGGIE